MEAASKDAGCRHKPTVETFRNDVKVEMQGSQRAFFGQIYVVTRGKILLSSLITITSNC